MLYQSMVVDALCFRYIWIYAWLFRSMACCKLRPIITRKRVFACLSFLNLESWILLIGEIVYMGYWWISEVGLWPNGIHIALFGYERPLELISSMKDHNREYCSRSMKTSTLRMLVTPTFFLLEMINDREWFLYGLSIN